MISCRIQYVWYIVSVFLVWVGMAGGPVYGTDLATEMDTWFTRLAPTGKPRKPTQSGQWLTWESNPRAWGVGVQMGRERIPLVEWDLPRIHTGCGGIDWHMGGLSFINQAQFKRLLSHIRSNATAFAMHLATEEMMPVVANVTKYLQDQVAKVNQATIHACEWGEAMVGGVVSRVRRHAQQACADWGVAHGWFGSWAEAKQACGPGRRFGEIARTADLDRRSLRVRDPIPLSKAAMGDQNITWDILEQMRLPVDHRFREVLMRMLGSLVVRHTQSSDPQIQILPAAGPDPALWGWLLEGGDLELYTCPPSGKRCIYPQIRSVHLEPHAAVFGRIQRQVEILIHKIRAREMVVGDFGDGLTPSEHDWVEWARLPVGAWATLTPSEQGYLAQQLAWRLLAEMVGVGIDHVERWVQQVPIDSPWQQIYIPSVRHTARQIRRYIRDETARLHAAQQQAQAWTQTQQRHNQQVARSVLDQVAPRVPGEAAPIFNPW